MVYIVRVEEGMKQLTQDSPRKYFSLVDIINWYYRNKPVKDVKIMNYEEDEWAYITVLDN